MVTEETYRDFYGLWDAMADERWHNTSRLDYKADVWYTRDRNRIVKDMIGNRWKGLEVLANGTGVGIHQWSDNEVLDSLGARVIKTSLVAGEGIDIACDACALPFQDNSFDAVFCREVIEHVINDFELVWEANRVLKPNGWLLLTTPNGFNCMPDGRSHLRAYSPQNFIDMVQHYKFKIVDKRGNVPNVFRSLFPLCRQGNGEVLEEFQKLAELWDKVGESYYFGGELYLLCQKGEACASY